MVRELLFITGILFASVVNAGRVTSLEDIEIKDGAQMPHDVLIQCGGIMLFTLEVSSPMIMPDEEMGAFTVKLDAYHEEQRGVFKMSDYFSHASETKFSANGLDFERANYQMGMSKFSAAQHYRDAYSDAMETTDQPWEDASPFLATYQTHMDICTTIYNSQNPNEPAQ